MKTTFRFTTLLLALLLCLSVFFTACGKADEEEEDKEIEREKTNEKTYEIIYTSYGDGTCYVSNVKISEKAKNLTIKIPERSPAGDKVIAYNSNALSSDNLIPFLITEEDFIKNIDEPLKEAVANGELSEFEYKKMALGFYFEESLEKEHTQEAKTALLIEYPVVALTDVYEFAPDASSVEKNWVQSVLREHTKYSAAQNAKDVNKLLDIAKKGGIEHFEKMIQVPQNTDAVVGIELPNSMVTINEFAFSGCKNLTANTYENAAYLGNSKNPYLYLMEYTLPQTEDLKNKQLAVSLHESVKIISTAAFDNYRQYDFVGNEYDNAIYLGTSSNPYLFLLKANNSKNGGFSAHSDTKFIASSAFEFCEELKEVNLPGSIVAIGNAAFSGCSQIEGISLPNGVTNIEDATFQNCSYLAKIFVPNKVTGIGSSAFKGCERLPEFTIPNGVTKIEASTFEDCIRLEKVSLPNGILTIGMNAFWDCNDLKNITIPASVVKIVRNAFYDCSKLESISVDPQNTVYRSVQNCLIHTATNTLLLGCKNSVIPSDGSVTGIGQAAFWGVSMQSIIIPHTVNYIGYSAFENCYALDTVYYGGTQEQWDHFFKNSNHNANNIFFSATFYIYSETQPTNTSGNYWHYVNGSPTAW